MRKFFALLALGMLAVTSCSTDCRTVAESLCEQIITEKTGSQVKEIMLVKQDGNNYVGEAKLYTPYYGSYSLVLQATVECHYASVDTRVLLSFWPKP